MSRLFCLFEFTSTNSYFVFVCIVQMSSASEHTSNIALLRSIFVENLDLLVVASEDNNICKYKLHAVLPIRLHTWSGFVIAIVKPYPSHRHWPTTTNRKLLNEWINQNTKQKYVTSGSTRKRETSSKGEKSNRPLALRGHVTNASLKQWVVVLLMPKIDRTHKNYLTPEIWEETHLREISYGTLIFQQISMICFGRHVGGHTLALQNGGQNYFLFISC